MESNEPRYCPSQEWVIIIIDLLPPCILCFICIASGCIPCLLSMRKSFLTKLIHGLVGQISAIVVDKILTVSKNKNGDKVYIVFSYKAPFRYTILLIVSMLQTFSYTSIEFWDVFLLEESLGRIKNGITCCYPPSETSRIIDNREFHSMLSVSFPIKQCCCSLIWLSSYLSLAHAYSHFYFSESS